MKKGAKHLWTCVAICWFASVVSSDQMKRAKLKSIKDADESHIDNEQKYPRQELVVEPKSRNTAEYLPEESYKEEQSTAAASGGYASRETQQINRIIGGGEVKNGRYPYIASLTKERSHVCGGSLIADDIILSAAHCGGHFDGVDVGRHDLDDKTEEMERYNVEKFLIHPQYKDASGSFDNDFMVIKLYGWSEFDTVRLNFNPNVPSAFEELYVAGWGVISTTTQETADKLKEVSVNYMTNEECKNKKGYVAGFSQIYSFQNKITDNMMCAIDVGEDACQGDSGGPLILKKASPQFDVQVGVVSWGLGCADPIFPGIYSRVSNQYQWIRDLVCSWAEKPPPFYACTPKQERPENPKRAVTLEIRLDRFPKETGWLIRSQYGKTNSYVATGRYSAYTGSSYQQKLVTTTVQLEEDTKYDLIMLDSYGDGLKFDGGYYKLWLGDAPYMGIQLVSGSVYGKFMKHPFYVPKSVATEQPIKAPSSPPQSLPPANAPTSIDVDDTPFLTIGFKFDKYPEQIGWAITSIETRKLLISKPFGSYTGKKNSLVFEKFTLPDPSTALSDQYIFAVLDSGRDGLCCENGQGFFQVFYGEMSDNNVMFRGGTFSYLDQFIFQLDGSVITSPPVYSPLRIDGGDQNPTDGPNPWGDDDTSKGTDSKCPQNLYSFAVAIGILSFSLL